MSRIILDVWYNNRSLKIKTSLKKKSLWMRRRTMIKASKKKRSKKKIKMEKKRLESRFVSKFQFIEEMF